MPPLVSAFRARPRLLLSIGGGLLLFWVLPEAWRAPTRGIVAWSTSILIYLALIFWMMERSSISDIRARSPIYDQGKVMVLILSVLAAAASFAAIIVELGLAKSGGHLALTHIALATVTVSLSWTFVHTMFALHYAHDFYAPEGEDRREGLEFPGTPEPKYIDFVYFAFVIGCACATADVNITSRGIRVVALVHGIIAFVFNTAIVALTINIAAGLLGSG